MNQNHSVRWPKQGIHMRVNVKMIQQNKNKKIPLRLVFPDLFSYFGETAKILKE
jgi:hypothetical protein